MKKKFSILVAEDDDGHFTLVKKNFQRMGFSSRIHRFVDGQEIVDFLFSTGPDKRREDESYLVLLDIRMPKVDGIEVLKRIKNDDQLKDLPVVMLTTSNEPQQIKQCEELGCDAYIVKPMEYEQFSDALEKVGQSFLLSILRVSGIGQG